MTYEEFKHLAEHPQHRDVPAIFKLEVLETEELEEKKRSHYPKYKVNTYCPQAFTTTLEGGNQQRLAETAWATQEEIRSIRMSHTIDIFRFIYIELILLADPFKCLNSYRI